MQEGAHQEDAAHVDLERPLHYPREGKIDQSKGWRRRSFESLKVISVGKDGGQERVPVP